MTVVFLDTETLGVDRWAPTWEFAAVRIEDDGSMSSREHFQIRHDRYAGGVDWLATLPPRFREDYLARYNEADAVPADHAADAIADIVMDGAVIAGSNPAFDMERLGDLLAKFDLTPGWQYHPCDVPMMAVGYLAARGALFPRPWRSDALSRACGIEPNDYDRHTAMGDVEWCWDLYVRIVASTTATGGDIW